MKRPSYRAAVQWIADNDAPGDDDPVDALAGYISVVLVADMFDVDQEKVALDVYRRRHAGAPPPPMPTVPSDFPVKVLGPNDPATDRVTCDGCGRSWDDAVPTQWTPAPSARCPFEYFHR